MCSVFEKISPLLLIGILTILSGLADAQGFLHAAKIWRNGSVAWSEVGNSALGFAIGISIYWLVLKFMNGIGIISPEIQTVTWFGMTLVGVALASGSFLRWNILDQGIAVLVLGGIGWLLLRTIG
jgi:hypothetical protein